MRPEEITKEENNFISSLTTGCNTKYTLKQTTDIGNNIKIYSIRPDYSSYYHPTKTPKKSICLHFTVGHIKADIETLTKRDYHVSVSYVVDRSGRIYELFPDTYWSCHLGKDAVGGNEVMSKQSIGIEISNYGPLTQSGENLMDSYKKAYCKMSETEYYYKHSYKHHEYYASMTDIQTEAVAALVKYLSRKHNIPMNFKGNDEPFASDKEAVSFNGVFYHTNVRKDKFDWPFGPALKAIIAACSDEKPSNVESKPDATKTEIKNEEPLPEVKPTTPTEPQPAQQQETKVEPKPATKPAPTTSQANSSTGKKSFIQAIIEFIMQLFGKKK